MIRNRTSFTARFFQFASLSIILAWMSACHSRYVETTIENRGANNLQMIEVDYPSASFGVGNLGGGSEFHYRFKIQGSGNLKLQFTDPHGQTHNVDGPELDEGQEGRLTITIDQAGRVAWQPSLTKNP